MDMRISLHPDPIPHHLRRPLDLRPGCPCPGEGEQLTASWLVEGQRVSVSGTITGVLHSYPWDTPPSVVLQVEGVWQVGAVSP
jgi:hypothetical protein